jgi:hypothetical protein
MLWVFNLIHKHTLRCVFKPVITSQSKSVLFMLKLYKRVYLNKYVKVHTAASVNRIRFQVKMKKLLVEDICYLENTIQSKLNLSKSRGYPDAVGF